MKNVAVLFVVGLGAGASGGCGSTASTPDAGVSIEAFTGTWVASTYVFTDNADTTQHYDIIAHSGEFRMSVLSGGRARTFLTIGTVEDEWDGLLTINGTTLTSTPQETTRRTRVYQFTLTGNQLMLTDANDAFDFTQSGATAVPATVTTTLTLQ